MGKRKRIVRGWIAGITALFLSGCGGEMFGDRTAENLHKGPQLVSGSDHLVIHYDWHGRTPIDLNEFFRDENRLHYRADNLPVELHLDTQSGRIDGNFTIRDLRDPVHDFSVTATDTRGLSLSVPVHLEVVGEPIEQVVFDSHETIEQRPLLLDPSHDLISAWDLNRTSLEIERQPAHGTAVADFNGTLVYLPFPDFNGSDTLEYRICDVHVLERHCASGTVSFRVTGMTDRHNRIRTDWGFVPFAVPESVEAVEPGDDLQAAIDRLAQNGGGTLQLDKGVYRTGNLQLPSKIVIQGAGLGSTVLEINGSGPMMEARDGKSDIVVREITVDCRNNGDHGCMEFNYGTHNVLIERVHVFGASRNNIIAWNEDWSEAGHFTVRNVISHDTRKWHGIALRFVKGAVVANNAIYRVAGNGVDLSRVDHGEVVNNICIDSGYGMKFPGSTYMYIHDNFIDEVEEEGGMKFNPMSDEYNQEYFHLENNEVRHSRGGIVDWGDSAPAPHFAEFVSKNNRVIDDYNGMNFIRLANGTALYDYGDNVMNRDGNPITDEFDSVVRREADQDPYGSDGVGYRSWPDL